MANGIRKNPDGSVQYNVNGKWVSQKPAGGSPGQAPNPHGKKPSGQRLTSNGPYGTTSTVLDKNGNVTSNNSLSNGQQNVLSGMEGASSGAYGALGGLIGQGNIGQNWTTAPGMQGYEDAMFQHLTRNTGADKAREGEQLTQTLANRGISVGSQLYNDQMKQFNNRYDDIYSDAQNQAVTGGVAAFNQGQQTANQGAGVLAGIGQGGFIQQQPTDINGLFSALTGNQLGQKQIDASLQAARIRAAQSGGGGGGRGPTAPLTASPFSGGAPPGYAPG